MTSSIEHGPQRPSRGLLAGVAGLVLAIGIGGYLWRGDLDAWRSSSQPPAGSPQAMVQEIGRLVGGLEERLKQSPDDAEGWMMLGRSYALLERHPEAVNAFQRALALRPDDASLLADLADATAMAAGRKLAGEPEALVQRALAIDPRNLKALALAGTAAFDRGDYATAARHWETAVAVAEPGSELARNLAGGVAEARVRAGLPPIVASAAPGGASAPSAAATRARVAGRVELSPALKAQAGPEDTVFVFARAAEGPRAPLAILRKQVKDLPFDFVLDESMAMNPAMSLASVPQVVVGARISKSGQAIAQAGDLQAISAPLAVGTEGIQLRISETVK